LGINPKCAEISVGGLSSFQIGENCNGGSAILLGPDVIFFGPCGVLREIASRRREIGMEELCGRLGIIVL
jgi:hypothetical protein